MKILLTGDLYIGENISIEEKALFHLNNNDYIISNFENVLDNISIEKRKDKDAILTFKDKELIRYLNFFDRSRVVFTLGNNHAHDLGEQGILNTINLLEKLDIPYGGLKNCPNIKIPIILNLDNTKIGILPVSTEAYQVMSIAGKEDNIGVLDYLYEDINSSIRKIKKSVDYLIILPHWGKEYMDYPSIESRQCAYSWIDNGADLIIGHHPHIIQGKEIYKGKYIYYSLGNFIFPNFYNKSKLLWSWKKINNYSLGISIDIDEKTGQVKISEEGYYFNTKENKLYLSDVPLEYLQKKSELLNREVVSLKEYYQKWENNYYTVLKKNRSISYKINSIFTSRHKEYSYLVYLLIRTTRKLKSLIKQ